MSSHEKKTRTCRTSFEQTSICTPEHIVFRSVTCRGKSDLQPAAKFSQRSVYLAFLSLEMLSRNRALSTCSLNATLRPKPASMRTGLRLKSSSAPRRQGQSFPDGGKALVSAKAFRAEANTDEQPSVRGDRS